MKFINIKTWNTGRQYTKNGQRMAAGFDETGRIHFVDIDRGICGILPVDIDNSLSSHWTIQEKVMRAYDTNNFEYDSFHKELMEAAKHESS